MIGWDSLEATSQYARWFSNLGHLALFLLLVFEILGGAYSSRETTLTAAAVARDADNKRAEAEARIAEAVAAAEIARRGAADANALAEAAKAESARANESSASLNQRAAVAELELGNIKRRQDWRKISNPTAARDAYKLLSDKYLSYLFQPGDEEAALLARSLHHMLRNGMGDTLSGIPVPIPANLYRQSLRNSPDVFRREQLSTPFMRIGSNAPGGITILSRDGETDAAVRGLKEILESFGLAVNIGETDSEMRPTTIAIVVGPKP